MSEIKVLNLVVLGRRQREKYVLKTIASAPTYTSLQSSQYHISSNDLPTHGDETKYESSIISYSPVFYPKQPLYSTSLSLQLVCKQIYNELKSLTSSDSTYHLDLAIVGDRTFYLTWLSLPPPSHLSLQPTIPKVHVDFRWVGPNIPSSKRGAFSAGCGGPAFAAWDLLSMLNRFLRRGPTFSSPAGGQGTARRVDNITFNVVSSGPSAGPPKWERGGDRGGIRDAEGAFDAKAALMLIEDFFSTTLLQTEGYYKDIPVHIYDMLGQMDFALDGIQDKSFDIAEFRKNE
ncbi:hypothetical protein BT69DRAFT_1317831 [Atractiella rhizophila]|nr:hypothetical protein BT69DRAFT_1317831 [Atractiella rhizophila]